ncbi:hypothetical protein B0T24DRAFT_253534 [Lasiosphaeria ovina]|uniref:Uncharacterized protein n=1 Tax=Lasiosphaeria ovina TaxID=92902 RepID=A0AAE0N8D9_9PEZI|nr:hypothetical protein B0T24DRAFT_253534 [Lasiosphaeria ovina]
MVTRIIVGAVQVGGSLFPSLHASLPNPLRSLGALFLVLHRLFLDWHNLDCSPLIRLVFGLANQSQVMDMHDKARFCQHCGRRLLPLEPSAFCRTSGLHDVIRKSAVPQPGLSSTRCLFTRQVDFFFSRISALPFLLALALWRSECIHLAKFFFSAKLRSVFCSTRSLFGLNIIPLSAWKDSGAVLASFFSASSQCH